MPDISASLDMPFIQPAQAQKHVVHNEALRILDMLVQPVVAQADLSVPPLTPIKGDSYVIAAGASGVWAGHEGQIAVWEDSEWLFAQPKSGWQVRDLATGQWILFDGTAWIADEQTPRLGINSTADDVNRLSVSSEATLFDHAGAGHQLKLNKSAVGDTASLVFQTGYSGRAEMGTAGSDGLAIKVSPDGAAWTTALTLDPTSGHATGAAVQASASDITPGRLMRADYGYGPGNLLGSVSESGGVPTGAVIERGSNANGAYIRFADGTQICTQEVVLSYVNGGLCSASWTFPAAFLSGNKPVLSGAVSANSLLATAPSVTPQQITGALTGTFSVTYASVQVRALAGAAFSAGETIVQRLMVIGRWV